MLKQKILHLKKLTTPKDAQFSDAFDHFLKLSEEDALLQIGKLITDTQSREFFTALLSKACERYQATLISNSSLFIKVKGHDLIHGTVFLSNGMHIVFYFFDDIQTGIAAVAMGGPDMEFIRLTAFMVPQSKNGLEPIIALPDGGLH